MIRLTSQELCSIFPQQSAIAQDFFIESVAIDSRKVVKGCLFVAIKGDNFDGRQFVASAAEQGAVAAIVESALDINIPQIIVGDSRKALAQLASYWRHKVNPLVIAITGSNGKTTVKEMLGKILSARDKTLMTPGNYNNEIGVPLTLFQLSMDDRFAIIEMGANHCHEIRQLVSVAEPDVVYVNNAGQAHVEGFGSLQGVIEAKGEMYQYCSNKAVAVYNEDEASVEYWKSVSKAEKSIGFSSQKHSDITGQGDVADNRLIVSVSDGKQAYDCQLSLKGQHNVHNALAAITLAKACGVTVDQACAALNGFSGVQGRQQFKQGLHGSVIIDDSYNANPASLHVAVKVLCSLDGEAWLALGDMAELGVESQQLHQHAVLDARNLGVKQMFALGENSCQAVGQFADNGHCFTGHSEMAEFISGRLHKGINLLVKGSRSAGMDKVVAALVDNINLSVETGVNHAL